MLGKHNVPALSNVATLAALAGIIVVAWAVMAFNRVGLAGSTDMPLPQTAAPVAPRMAATPVSTQTPGRSTVLAKREAIVYVVEGDATYFHSPIHTMHDAQRQAVSLSMAKAKGLGPCPVCFKNSSR